MIGEKWIKFHVDEIGMIKIDFSKGEIIPEVKNSQTLVKAKEWILDHFQVTYDDEKAVWICQAEKVKKEIENRSEYFGKYLNCKGLKKPSPDNYVVGIKFPEEEKDTYSYRVTLNTGEVVYHFSY